MESFENKDKMANNNGIEGIESTISQGVKEDKLVANYKAIWSLELLLRVLAIVLTLSASVILGANKQTKVVDIQLVETLPPLSIQVTAKWHYLSAFVYFVVTNAIACMYGMASLVLALVNPTGKANTPSFVTVALDAIMTGLLFSSTGAATAIGVIGFKGNSHVQWKKVCNVFDKFCDQSAFALGASLLGAIVFLLLVILAAKRLHNNK